MVTGDKDQKVRGTGGGDPGAADDGELPTMKYE